MNGDDQNKIDDLNKTLYSRNTPDIRTKRRLRLHESDVEVKTDWEHPQEERTLPNDLLNEKYNNLFYEFTDWSYINSIPKEKMEKLYETLFK